LTEPEDLESHYKPAADIWRSGCAGETLQDKELHKFSALCRNRFHTFHLSITHAQVSGDGKKVDALIRGLAVELSNAPGLVEQWQASEFSNDDFGTQVTALTATLRTADKS
jgi:hypothetical protein